MEKYEESTPSEEMINEGILLRDKFHTCKKPTKAQIQEFDITVGDAWQCKCKTLFKKTPWMALDEKDQWEEQAPESRDEE